jgi:hypothetical protein
MSWPYRYGDFERTSDTQLIIVDSSDENEDYNHEWGSQNYEPDEEDDY